MSPLGEGQKVCVWQSKHPGTMAFVGQIGTVRNETDTPGMYLVQFARVAVVFDREELKPIYPPLRVYLAGTGHDPEIADQRIPGFITATGHALVSTWHAPGVWMPGTTTLSDAASDAIAERNLADLAQAEVLLVKIPPVAHHLRGAHVECGVALARNLKVLVWGQPGDLNTMVPRSRCTFAPNWAEINGYLMYWAKNEDRL